jgi:hypothetical protein
LKYVDQVASRWEWRDKEEEEGEIKIDQLASRGEWGERRGRRRERDRSAGVEMGVER